MLTRLPHRVIIQSESVSAFQGGCSTSSWITGTTEWANCQIQDKTSDSNESYEQYKKQQYNIWSVIMRKQTNVTNSNRLLFDPDGGENYKILTVETSKDLTARGRMIKVECREELDN